MGYVPFALDRFAEDPSFAELALHATNSLHQTGGVDFDKSFEISMENDVQVSVVELKLPLGCKLRTKGLNESLGWFRIDSHPS